MGAVVDAIKIVAKIAVLALVIAALVAGFSTVNNYAAPLVAALKTAMAANPIGSMLYWLGSDSDGGQAGIVDILLPLLGVIGGLLVAWLVYRAFMRVINGG